MLAQPVKLIILMFVLALFNCTPVGQMDAFEPEIARSYQEPGVEHVQFQGMWDSWEVFFDVRIENDEALIQWVLPFGETGCALVPASRDLFVRRNNYDEIRRILLLSRDSQQGYGNGRTSMLSCP